MPQMTTQFGSGTTPSSVSTVNQNLSIAVIPFSSLNPEGAGCFSDTVTESIVTGLAQFREFDIIGPLEEYKNSTVEIGALVRRYRARFVLQGRVQIYNGIIRVSAGLTDTGNGVKIWAQSYEYSKTVMNFIEIEDDVTRRVVSALVDYGGIIPCLISQESMQKHLDNTDIQEAIFRQEQYLKVFTMDAYFAAVEALEHAYKTNPDNALVLAMLCNAYCYNYVFDIGLETASLEKAERLARRAASLDPECQILHFNKAILYFIKGQSDFCVTELRMATALNPFNAYIIYGSGMLFSMLGHWKEGLQLWKQAMRSNPHYPSLDPFVPFMYHYFHGNYKKAWGYVQRFHIPVLWDPLMRAAAAGQLGFYDVAKTALQELMEIRPDFPSRARDLMRRVVYLEEHVDLLLDGLLKAGLKLKVLK
jgi:TolB-like protein/tetratricopeptide (TPR) repeat protein